MSPTTTLRARATTTAGEFLRKMRARARPTVQDGERRARRTPGLRREEVAERAGMSVDWYVRLEQDRAERPSVGVLDALARVLGLSAAERRYLFRLARGEAPPARVADGEAHPSLVAAQDALVEPPSLILGPRMDILRTNPRGEALFGFGDDGGPFARNAVWFTMCHPRARTLFIDYRAAARDTVGSMRAAFARTPLDTRFLSLVAELSRVPLFVELWSEQYVTEKSLTRKSFAHAKAGRLELVVHSLVAPDVEGQSLLFLTPHDAATRTRLARLDRP